MLKAKALKFNPDIIILAYVLNDPFPSDAIIGFFNRIDDRKQSTCKIPLISLRMPCALADFINNLKTIIHSRVAQRAEKNGFYVIDILDEYKKYKDEELKIQDTDIYHPNRLGHEIAADAIYKRLLNIINVSSS